MDEDRERALLSRCRQGDRDAFAELVAAFERPVFGVAYRMLGNEADAADVAQSVFLKVYEHLDAYDERYRAFSWVYRIAVNESLDRLQWYQRNGDAGRAQGEGGTRGQAQDDDPAADREQGPDAQLQAGQLHDCVQAALMELQHDHRAAIVLRHFSGCSYAEIADILHVPEKTVKSRLYSARQALRERLCAHGVEAA